MMKIPFIERPQKIFTDYSAFVHYDDNKQGFDYFQNTPYSEIDFNDNDLHSMVWFFFTTEATAYFLGKLIQEGYRYPLLSNLHEMFILYFHSKNNINNIVELLTEEQKNHLLNWFEHLLNSLDEDWIYIYGEEWEESLQKNIEFLKKIE